MPHAHRDYRSSHVGTDVTYTCYHGYRHVSGDLTRRCENGGVYSGDPPVCERKAAFLIYYHYFLYYYYDHHYHHHHHLLPLVLPLLCMVEKSFECVIRPEVTLGG